MHKQPTNHPFSKNWPLPSWTDEISSFSSTSAALIFSLFSQGWVKVCNDLTQYLPENTETRQGLTIMEDEFITYGTAGSCCPT